MLLKKIIFHFLYPIKNIYLLYSKKKYKKIVFPYNGTFPLYPKVLLNNEEIISKLIYKDNTWNHIKHISDLMWNDIFKYTPFKHYGKSLSDNNCQEKYIQRSQDYIICRVPAKEKNEWILLQLKHQENVYEFSFDSIIKSQNTEFQIAFNFESITRRYRFNLVDNKTVNFDIIENGDFHNELLSIPFTLELNKLYHFKLKVDKNKFQYLINEKIILSIFLKTKHILRGDIALIFWNSDIAPINIICNNFSLKVTNNENRNHNIS